MIKNIYESDKVIDFVWKMSQNKEYSSYPRRDTLDEVREDIEKAISQKNNNIIAYYNKDLLVGVCSYFWIEEEKYSQTTIFLIQDDYEEIANKFINYIRKELLGYELLIGISTYNENANQFFIKNEIECIESSIVAVLDDLQLIFKNRNISIEIIDIKGFQEYAIFHDKYAVPSEIYYDSKNLLKEIEKFRIFVYKKNGEIQGSIFIKVGEIINEVFGLFINKEFRKKGIEIALISEMLINIYNEFSELKKILYFIDENSLDEINAAFENGFKIKDKWFSSKNSG